MGLGGLAAADDRLAAVQELEARLAALGQQAEVLQAREEIFGLSRTEYPALAEVSKALEPYAALWRCVAEWGRCLPDWMDGPFTEVDAETVGADVDRCGATHVCTHTGLLALPWCLNGQLAVLAAKPAVTCACHLPACKSLTCAP